MNMEGEAASVVANQVIHIVVEGFEMILRLSGKGLKELSEMLYVAFKNHEGKDTPGKQKLAKILQTGTPRVFDLPKDEIKNFAKEAKRYGISYCVLKPSKLEENPKFEVIVHQEDAERVSRIMNRVHTATVEVVPEKDAKEISLTTEEDLLSSLFIDTQQGQTQVEGPTGKASSMEEPERTQPDSLDDLGLELFSEEGLDRSTSPQNENPMPSRTQPNDHPYGHFSEKSSNSSEKKVSKNERSSVREELKNVKKELDAKKAHISEKGPQMPKVPTPKVTGKER